MAEPSRSKYVLLPGDVRSETWKRLEAQIRSRLEFLREQNDDPSSSDTESTTARRRGRIAELKLILALAEPEKK